jgi:hypothetical protein
MDPEIEIELTKYLLSDEKLIWTGKPKTGIVFRSSDAFLIPFSIIWGGFSVFWETNVLSSEMAFPFALFGLPFIVIGLYITVGRFFVDAKKRSNTIYGVTTDRVLIKTGVFNSELISLYISTIPEITYKEKSDGSGTINLGYTDIRYAMMQGMEWPGVKQTPRLEFVKDIRSVYNLILEHKRHK